MSPKFDVVWFTGVYKSVVGFEFELNVGVPRSLSIISVT